MVSVERQRSTALEVELDSERDLVRSAEDRVDNEKARGDAAINREAALLEEPTRIRAAVDFFISQLPP